MAIRYRVDMGALKADLYYYAIPRQRKILHRIMNQFRSILDPDRLHTHWCVSDWFYWKGWQGTDYNFGLIVKRMDGGTPPQPTGDEFLWAICWPTRDSPYPYYNAYTKFGSNATEANKYFWFGWDQTINTAYYAQGLFLFRHSFTNFREVEMTGAGWTVGGPFSVGDLIEDGSGFEKVGEVIWVDGLDDKHIIARMKTGFNFETGEDVQTDTAVLNSVTIDDVIQWNIELTGNAWAIGGPFAVGETVYNSAYPERKAVVKWVDPLDDRHIRVLMTENARFRDADDLERDAGNQLSNITINDANMHDCGFDDNVLGIKHGQNYVSVRNVNNNGGTDFTEGETIICVETGAEATFSTLSPPGLLDSWPVQRIHMDYVIGDWRPGMTISTDRGGPTDATAIIMPTCWVQTNTSSGTYQTGEEIYTTTGKAFVVKGPVSSTLQFLWGGRMDLVSTDFNGVPDEGEFITNTDGSTEGLVASVDFATPGQIRWTVIYNNAPFETGEDIFVVGDPTEYVNDVVVQNHITGEGMFWHNQTLSGRTSGVARTTRGEDYNYYVNPHTAPTSMYNQINDFFPLQRSAAYNNAPRGIWIPNIRYDADSADHAAQVLIFGWDHPFMAVYHNERYDATVQSYHVLGQIVSPLQGIRADPYVYGTFGSRLTATAVNPGAITNYRMEGVYGFAYGGGVLTTFTTYYNTNFSSLTMGQRADGDWDWTRVTLANSSEFKGYLDERLFRTIGFSGTYEYMKMYDDQTDSEVVFIHLPDYYSVPWKAGEQAWPPINWESSEMDTLYRERY